VFLKIGRLFKFLIGFGILAVIACTVFYSKPIQRIFYPLLYQEYVFKYAENYQVDPFLVAAVIRKESRYSPTAVSPTGARGLMQIMPDTADWASRQLGIEFHQDLLFDPEYNIRMGCWYLRRLQDTFPDNLPVALASYNAGQGNVGRWLKEGVWNGELSHLNQIPFPETRIYVSKVLTYYRHYQRLYHGDMIRRNDGPTDLAVISHKITEIILSIVSGKSGTRGS
jgi:soluble lytic murein transglycosylase